MTIGDIESSTEKLNDFGLAMCSDPEAFLSGGGSPSVISAPDSTPSAPISSHGSGWSYSTRNRSTKFKTPSSTCSSSRVRSFNGFSSSPSTSFTGYSSSPASSNMSSVDWFKATGAQNSVQSPITTSRSMPLASSLLQTSFTRQVQKSSTPWNNSSQQGTSSTLQGHFSSRPGMNSSSDNSFSFLHGACSSPSTSSSPEMNFTGEMQKSSTPYDNHSQQTTSSALQAHFLSRTGMNSFSENSFNSLNGTCASSSSPEMKFLREMQRSSTPYNNSSQQSSSSSNSHVRSRVNGFSDNSFSSPNSACASSSLSSSSQSCRYQRPITPDTLNDLGSFFDNIGGVQQQHQQCYGSQKVPHATNQPQFIQSAQQLQSQSYSTIGQYQQNSCNNYDTTPAANLFQSASVQPSLKEKHQENPNESCFDNIGGIQQQLYGSQQVRHATSQPQPTRPVQQVQPQNYSRIDQHQQNSYNNYDSTPAASHLQGASVKPSLKEKQDGKPKETYVALIAKALLSSPSGRMTLTSIYDYITDNYEFYRTTDLLWRNAVRHNLSINDCFIKAGRTEIGRGYFWALHPSCVQEFRRGDFRRKKSCNKAKSQKKRPPQVPSSLQYALQYQNCTNALQYYNQQINSSLQHQSYHNVAPTLNNRQQNQSLQYSAMTSFQH